MKKEIELLAPAGTWEALEAAVTAGAKRSAPGRMLIISAGKNWQRPCIFAICIMYGFISR